MKAKVKILDSLPEVGDAEIENLMSFDELYQDFQLVKLAGAKLPLSEAAADHSRYWKGVLIFLGVGLISLMTFRLIWQEPVDYSHSSPVQGEATVETPEEVMPLTIPVEEKVPKNERPEKIKPVESEIYRAPEVEKKVDQAASKGFKPAEPVSGYENLYEFFAREVQYKGELLTDSVTRSITVEFSITSDGKVAKVQVQNSVNEEMDVEALRLVKSMPEWKPATMNGKPVESRLNIPLSFGITNETIKK